MENNYLTAGELALLDQRTGYNYGGYYRKGNATATTGVALAAGLGGGALLLAIAGIWGVNAASKARARGAENLANANTNYINQMAGFVQAERVSRESWQNVHAPSTTQYVDVQTGAGSFSGSNANALATAIAQNSGINSAIGGCNYLRVARFAPAQGCPCDSCVD